MRERPRVCLVDWLAENVTTDPRALEWFGQGDHSDKEEAEMCERRIAKGYRELLSGYSIDPSKILKTTRKIKQKERISLVRIENINFFSICAHHFLPFFGKVDIVYLAGDRILGLGKFPRLVQAYSRRFQIQEDLVREIAEEILSSGHARGVKVSSESRHLCMCARGPNDHTVITKTEYTSGELIDR